MSIACANYKLFKLISTDNHEWFTKRFTKMIRAILTLRNSSKFLNYINLNYVFKLIDNDSWMIKKTWTRKYIRSNQSIFIKLGRIVKGEIWLKLRSATRMLIVKKRRRSVKNILITDDLYVSINGQMGRGEERMKAVIRSQIFFFSLICSRDVTLKLRITISREKPEWKIDGRAVTRNFNKKFLTFRCVTPHCGHKLSLLNTFLPSFKHRLVEKSIVYLFCFQSRIRFLMNLVNYVFNRRDSN